MKTIYLVKEKESIIYVSYDKENVDMFIESNMSYYSSLRIEEERDDKLFVVLCSNIRRHKGLYGTRMEVYKSYKEYKEFLQGDQEKMLKSFTTYKFNDEEDSYDKQIKELIKKVEKEYGKDYILLSH